VGLGPLGATSADQGALWTGAEVIASTPHLGRIVRVCVPTGQGFDCVRLVTNEIIVATAPASEACAALSHASDRCWTEHQHGIEPAERK
jgi:hypothetical protein